MTDLSPQTIELLRHVSVATLCTQVFKRGFRNLFIQGIARLTEPSGGNLVGPAFTMRNIPSREDLDQLTGFENPEHPQRKGIESVPPGHVLVIDCRGETRAASGGQIRAGRAPAGHLSAQCPDTRGFRGVAPGARHLKTRVHRCTLPSAPKRGMT